jgi:hypothetical protein
MERTEKQKQLSRSFHRPLEISQKTRDFHIPTAQLRGHGKGENQNQVSPFPTAARNDDSCFLIANPKNKKGNRPLQGILLLHFQDHLVLETEPDFRIILRLENARMVAARREPAKRPGLGELSLAFVPGRC